MCIKLWLSIKQTCPHTNQLLTSKQFFPQQLFSKNLLGQQRVVCCNSVQGCSWHGEYKDIIAHLENQCDWEYYECANLGCGQRVLAKWFSQHQAECVFSRFSASGARFRLRSSSRIYIPKFVPKKKSLVQFAKKTLILIS